jgi:hypothetical protein
MLIIKWRVLATSSVKPYESLKNGKSPARPKSGIYILKVKGSNLGNPDAHLSS